MLQPRAASVYFIKGVIAGRWNLRYFDRSRNDMRFSPTGGSRVVQSFVLRDWDRSARWSRWNVND